MMHMLLLSAVAAKAGAAASVPTFFAKASAMVIGVVGSFFGAILAVKAAGHFMGDNHMHLVAMIPFALIAAFVIYEPTQVATLLQNTVNGF